MSVLSIDERDYLSQLGKSKFVQRDAFFPTPSIPSQKLPPSIPSPLSSIHFAPVCSLNRFSAALQPPASAPSPAPRAHRSLACKLSAASVMILNSSAPAPERILCATRSRRRTVLRTIDKQAGFAWRALLKAPDETTS